MYIAYFLIWIVLNGRVTTEIVVFGLVISVALEVFRCKVMDVPLRAAATEPLHAPRYVKFIGLLVRDIVKSSLAVIRLVLKPKLEIEPQLVYFHTSLKGDADRVLLANSITLTPGTITVGLRGDQYHVHALDKAFLEGLSGGEIERELLHAEEKK